jgi:serine protease Do
VKDVRALARAIAQTPPGTVISLTVWRDDETMVIAATVQELKQADRVVRPNQAKEAGPADPGWRLTRVDEAARRISGPSRASGGVVVTKIDPDGTAAEAGLQSGDAILQVQQEKTAGPDDVARAVSRAWR